MTLRVLELLPPGRIPPGAQGLDNVKDVAVPYGVVRRDITARTKTGSAGPHGPMDSWDHLKLEEMYPGGFTSKCLGSM